MGDLLDSLVSCAPVNRLARRVLSLSGNGDEKKKSVCWSLH